jgi:asparagine synthase (glutamine-hydrolysing)
VIENDSVEERRYWRYPEPTLERGGDVGRWSERLLAALEESVRLRLMSDVPLGAMLSGGLDSSLIVALMAQQMDSPVHTFAVGFAESGASNELADARFVADFLGADHHELELSVTEQTVSLDRLLWHLDEPVADLSSLGFLALSELASQHVTVALSGQGADELLGGYRKHRAAALAGTWKRLPSPIRRAVLAGADHGPRRFQRPVATLAADGAAQRLLSMSGALSSSLRSRLVRGPLAELDGNAALRAISYRLGDFPDAPLPATLYLDGQLGLPDDMLHYFDRASMAHSLEVRVPFLDHHVVELCASIPANLKVRRLDTKHVLKHAARGLVPDRIIDKPKIGFFNAAVDDWFRGQARGAISDYLLGPNPRYADMLDRSEVERLIKGRVDGSRSEGGYALLSILMLEVWLSEYLPRATRTSAPTGEPVRTG